MTQKLERKHVNRPAISLAILAGMMIGAAPLFILLDRVDGWLLVSAVAWAAATVYLLFNKKKTYHKPNAGEYILSAFDATFGAAFAGLLGMALYALVLGLVAGSEWLVGLFSEVDWDQAQTAYLVLIYTATAIFGLLGIVYAEMAVEALAPETAGLRSPYYYLLTVDRKFLRANFVWLFIFLGLMVLALFVWPQGWVSLVLFETYLFFGTVNFLSTNIETRIEATSGSTKAPETERVPASTSQQVASVANSLLPGQKSPEQLREERAIEIAREMYAAAAWEVELAPRTADPGIDPLLVDIDLLAVRQGQTVVVDVITTEAGAPFADIRRPAVIQQAVWLLADQRSLDPNQVTASMLLVECPVDEKLLKVVNRLGIHLVMLDEEDTAHFRKLSTASAQGDADTLAARAALAERLLKHPDPVPS